LRTALSEITTVGSTFAEDVAAYAAAGFDAIGLWEFKLPDDDEANIALLAEHGLAVANCIPAIPSILQFGLPGMEGPPDTEERIAALCASMARFAAYAPECVVCLSGPLNGRVREEGRALVVDGLRRIAAAAQTAGVRLGFEPVHPSQEGFAAFVTSLAETHELLAEPGLDGVGVLFDTYNLADDPDAFGWIAANAHRVAGVHVADWPSRERTDRVLPGEGITPSRELVQALRAAGWDGSVDVELFSTPERFWGLPVDEAARRAYAAARALW
jgi:sugar phosphate isomerase/epimerase